MAFTFTDQHLDQYHTQGYTVFRQILPPALLGELRRVAAKAREIARQQRRAAGHGMDNPNQAR